MASQPLDSHVARTAGSSGASGQGNVHAGRHAANHTSNGPVRQGDHFSSFGTSQNNNTGPGSQFNLSFNVGGHSDGRDGAAGNRNRQGRIIRFLRDLHTSPYEDRKDLNPTIVPGTCKWFQSHRLFLQWRDGVSSILWVSADPGCGKSVLARHLIDNIVKSTETTTVCYFFFKDSFADQKSITSAISCILRQLFLKLDALLSDTILEDFEKEGKWILTSFQSLWKLLINAAESKGAGQIIVILDAIDECENDGRVQLCKAMYELYDTGRCPNLRFFITSRPYESIRLDFQPLENTKSPIIRLSGENDDEMDEITKEIDMVIKARIQIIAKRLGLEIKEHKMLLEQLIRIPNRTYLWAHLTLELIEREISINKTNILRITSELPQSVDEAYDQILSKSCDTKKAKKVLHLVVGAIRPLTTEEMSLVLSIKQDGTFAEIEPQSDDRFRRTLRDVCGLVTIVDSRIYLLHQTVKEFLVPTNFQGIDKGPYHDSTWKNSIQLEISHVTLASICMEYLLNPAFDKPFYLSTNNHLAQRVFWEYSASYWAAHYRQMPIERQQGLIESAFRLCNMSSNFSLNWFRVQWDRTKGPFPEGFTNIMLASYLGLKTVVAHLIIQDISDIDRQDQSFGRTPLCWAAMNGFGDVAKLLIKGAAKHRILEQMGIRKKAKVNLRDVHGRTPLVYAIWNNDDTLIQKLLAAGAKTGLADSTDGTPISYAICNGRKEVIGLLLKGKNEDSESVRQILGKLLFSAVMKSDEAVASLVINAGITSLNARCEHDFETNREVRGLTALHIAIQIENESMVKLLLAAKKVNINTTDYFGRTPIHFASKIRNSDIFKLLLSTDRADLNVKDVNGKTPIHYACEFMNADICKLILSTNQVDLNAKDNNDQAPIHYACKPGNLPIFRLLSETNQVDLNAKDKSDWAPIHYACYSGDANLVTILLDKIEVDFNSRNKEGQRVIDVAIEGQHPRVIDILANRAKGSVNQSEIF